MSTHARDAEVEAPIKSCTHGQQAQQIAKAQSNLEEWPSTNSKAQEAGVHEESLRPEAGEHTYWIGAGQYLHLQEDQGQHLNHHQCQKMLCGIPAVLIHEMLIDDQEAGQDHQQSWKSDVVVFAMQDSLCLPKSGRKHC